MWSFWAISSSLLYASLLCQVPLPTFYSLNTPVGTYSETSLTSETMSAATSSLIDVLIIGGGPGGLAVANGLARQLYTAVVFDSGVYRNRMTSHMHNVVTWDHGRPSDFRQKARDDIQKRYDTIQFQATEIQSVKKMQEGPFEAVDASGKVWTGRKVVLATGIRDIYPDIDGYGECWGTGM